MSLFNYLNVLWMTLRGTTSGVDFIIVYDAIGAAIWGLLLFKVFLTEGLNVASGEKTELPKIFVKYLFVAGMFAIWPVASNHIFSAVSSMAEAFFPDLNSLFTTMQNAMSIMSAGEDAGLSTWSMIQLILGNGGAGAAAIAGTLFNGLLIIIGTLTLFLCYMLVLVNIAGSLAILAMNLVIGPVFFALAFDRDFRSIAIHWFSAVLSYMLLMPLYGAALRMAAAMLAAGVPSVPMGFVSTGQVAAQLLAPFMAVGIIFSTNKVVSALVGGAAGSGLGSSVMGTAGIAAGLIPGARMIGATASAGSAAANKAFSGGGTSGGSFNGGGSGTSGKPENSQTAKSAIGGMK